MCSYVHVELGHLVKFGVKCAKFARCHNNFWARSPQPVITFKLTFMTNEESSLQLFQGAVYKCGCSTGPTKQTIQATGYSHTAIKRLMAESHAVFTIQKDSAYSYYV